MEDDLHALQLRIGKKVKQLRILQGLSQEELAHSIGRERKHISEVELGRVNLTLESLWRLATKLAVDVPELCESGSNTRLQSHLLAIEQRDLQHIRRIIDRVEHAGDTRARAKRRRPRTRSS